MSTPPTPTLAELLGLPREVEFRGTTYAVRAPTVAELDMFGVWLGNRGLAAAERAVEFPEEARRQMRRDVLKDIAAGEYEAFSEAGAAAMGTPAGRAKLLHLVLRSEHPEVTEQTARDMLGEKAAEVLIAQAAGEVSPDDPKAAATLSTLSAVLAVLSSSGCTASNSPPSTAPPPTSGG